MPFRNRTVNLRINKITLIYDVLKVIGEPCQRAPWPFDRGKRADAPPIGLSRNTAKGLEARRRDGQHTNRAPS